MSEAITEIPDGPYYLYYKLGSETGKFNEMLIFTSTSEKYTIYTVPLSPANQSKYRISIVDAKDFPQ
jgi:hypothetical protein